MKIKTKKEMNLPELIKWAWENNIKNERYRCSDIIPYEYVWINENNDVELDDDMRISKNDTFTVEVEERIDEETVIPKLIVEYSYCSDVDLYKCFKVGDFMNDNAKSIYILNDDLTTTLIWTKEKGWWIRW